MPENDLPDPVQFLEIVALEDVVMNSVELSEGERCWLPRDLAALMVSEGKADPHLDLGPNVGGLPLNRTSIGEAYRQYLAMFPGLAAYATRTGSKIEPSGMVVNRTGFAGGSNS